MNIALAGTGNVAHILGKAFLSAGHRISWVYGRDAGKAKALAGKLKTVHWDLLRPRPAWKPHILVIAVKDDAIGAVSAHFKTLKSLVVHTSGSASLDILKKHHLHAGVFYPLQTFSKNSRINLKTTPFCLESAHQKDMIQLERLASSISGAVYHINSRQRQELHLAAVFANNFSNFLFTIAEEILSENKLPFDLLKPIILTAAKNLQVQSPSLSQTGPAIRHDQLAIQKHLAMLKKNPTRSGIYRLLTEAILSKYPVKG